MKMMRLPRTVHCFGHRLYMVAIYAFITAATLSSTANALELLVGTGENGTFSHFTGRMICRVVNNADADLTCTPMPVPDDMHALTNLQGGSLDLALVDSTTYHDAVNKAGHFEFLDIRYDNLRTLTPLCGMPVTLVVREDAEIIALDSLKGKRLNAGAPRSTQHQAVDTLMDIKKWSTADFSLVSELPASQSQDTMAFCHGTVQAMVHIGVHPDAALTQLIELCRAKLVGIHDADVAAFIDGHKAFFETTIEGGVYPSQPEKIQTLGTRVLLVGSEELDADTVHAIMTALHAGRDRLQHAHPALTLPLVDPANPTGVVGELHPGAVEFLTQ